MYQNRGLKGFEIPLGFSFWTLQATMTRSHKVVIPNSSRLGAFVANKKDLEFFQSLERLSKLYGSM